MSRLQELHELLNYRARRGRQLHAHLADGVHCASSDRRVWVCHVLGNFFHGLRNVDVICNGCQYLELKQLDACRIVVAAEEMLEVHGEDLRDTQREQYDVLQAGKRLLENPCGHQGQHWRLQPGVDLLVHRRHALRQVQEDLGSAKHHCAVRMAQPLLQEIHDVEGLRSMSLTSGDAIINRRQQKCRLTRTSGKGGSDGSPLSHPLVCSVQ